MAQGAEQASQTARLRGHPLESGRQAPGVAFADSASRFIADRPDAATRRLAWSVFEAAGLPTTTDEVWRYAPLGDLDLGHFEVPSAPTDPPDSDFAAQLCQRAGLVVRVVDGFCVSTGDVVEGVNVEIEIG